MPAPFYTYNEDEKLFSVNYYDGGNLSRKLALEKLWKTFSRTDPVSRQTYRIWFRPTDPRMEITVDHRIPPNAPAGKYRIETFVPGKYATSRKAIFTIFHNFQNNGDLWTHDTAMAVVDMYELYDVWHTLGEFQLDPSSHPMSGCVRQFDLSLETPPASVSFGPMRWVPLFLQPIHGLRYDSPVGTEEERDGIFPTGRVQFGRYPVWAGFWFDVNPFLTWYEYGYHTGADLNLPGSSSADKGKPIYSIAQGTVTYAGKAGTWGNIIVIEHPNALVTLPDGSQQHQRVYSRYGHVDSQIKVRTGQDVDRGENIGFIGLPANQTTGWHLHFDVSYTDILRTRPAHWPNLSSIKTMNAAGVNPDDRGLKSLHASIMREVVSNYLDPLKFIRDNHG